MNPPNEDQHQRIEPNAGDWTTTMQDEWTQRRQVAPNGDIHEGRRVHKRGYNDSHPAPNKTSQTRLQRQPPRPQQNDNHLTRQSTGTQTVMARARKVDHKGDKRGTTNGG